MSFKILTQINVHVNSVQNAVVYVHKAGRVSVALCEQMWAKGKGINCQFFVDIL